jgi:hypothetical protein
MREDMRTLVYKRTHNGDPDRHGRFGCNRCMGWVRSWDFGAVIGVGGQGKEARDEGIAQKVNWIGVGPRVVGYAADGYPILRFNHFRDFVAEGRELPDVPRCLARRMYGGKVRATMRFGSGATTEINRLLRRAKKTPLSDASSRIGKGGRLTCPLIRTKSTCPRTSTSCL